MKDHASGEFHVPGFDGNRNITRLIKYSDKTVSAEYEYGPYGGLLRATGPMAQANPFRFSSEYHDDVTGLVYYGYRYYSPQTRRWLSKDPIGLAGGLNLYGFVGNDPVNNWDLLGLDFDVGDDVSKPITPEELQRYCKYRADERERKAKNKAEREMGAGWLDEHGMPGGDHNDGEGGGTHISSGLPDLARSIADKGHYIIEFTPQGTFMIVVQGENSDGSRASTKDRLIGAGTSYPGMSVGGKALKFSGTALKDLLRALQGKKGEEAEALLAKLATAENCIQKSKRWPKHHPWPQYLGGLRDQTLKKMPLSKHKDFHYDLDHWKDSKYSRNEGAEHFKDMDPNQIIADLRDFYTNFENGKYREYLPDFERAVKETTEAF